MLNNAAEVFDTSNKPEQSVNLGPLGAKIGPQALDPEYIDWYNSEHGHSSLDGKTPEQVWQSSLLSLREAA